MNNSMELFKYYILIRKEHIRVTYAIMLFLYHKTETQIETKI